MSYGRESTIERNITNTLVMLCKNSIAYSTELKIQGTLGITVDDSVFLIHFDQRFDANGEPLQDDGLGVGLLNSSPDALTPPAKRARPSVIPSGRGRPPLSSRTSLPFSLSRRGTARGGFPRTRGLQFGGRGGTVGRGGAAGVGVPRKSMSQPNTPKQEMTEVKQEMGGSRFRKHQSSDVIICLESDDDETDVKPRLPKIPTTPKTPRMMPKMERVLETAINRARAIQKDFSESSSFGYSSQNASGISSGTRDIKPAVVTSVQQEVTSSDSSTQQQMVPWTPTRVKQPPPVSPNAAVLRTPTHIKTEQVAGSPAGSCGGGGGGKMMLHSPTMIRSPSVAAAQSPWRQGVVVATGSPGPVVGSPSAMGSSTGGTTWTSLTQTTFVCTTNGCSSTFTTKRAMVRHQRTKHLMDVPDSEFDSSAADADDF